ncbi:MAG: hypothetical protein ACK54L_17310, partial [Betaproteobacteria bacterium]
MAIMTPGRLPTRTTLYRGETMNRKRSLRTLLLLLAAAADAAPALARQASQSSRRSAMVFIPTYPLKKGWIGALRRAA